MGAKISIIGAGSAVFALMAGSLLASIPTILVYLIFQRNFVRGVAISGI